MKGWIILIVIIALAAGAASTYFFMTPPVCETDLQCGIEHQSDTNYCDGNTIKLDTISYTCLNPGTRKSSCQENKAPQIQKECIYPYKCGEGQCLQQTCYDIPTALWLGGPAKSRIFFDTPKQRSELILLVMRTGATFKVHLYTDNNGLPDMKLNTWGPLSDNSIDDSGWVRLKMEGIGTMPPGYYWIGIEVMQYGNMAFNTCVTNDRKDDTWGREDTITDGKFESFQDYNKNENDIIYAFN